MSSFSPNSSENRQNQNLIQVRETEEDEFYKEQQLYKGAQLQKKNIHYLNSQVSDFKQINKRNEDEVDGNQQTNNYFLKTNSLLESVNFSQNLNLVNDIHNSSNKATIDQIPVKYQRESHHLEQHQQQQITFQAQFEQSKAKSIDDLLINESKNKRLNNQIEGMMNQIGENKVEFEYSLSQNTSKQNNSQQQLKKQMNAQNAKEIFGDYHCNQTHSSRIKVAYQVFEFIKRMKRNVLSKKINNLPEKFMFLINDLSSGEIKIKKNNISQQSFIYKETAKFGKLFSLIANLKVFNQNSIEYIIIRMATLILILLYFIWIPLRFSFDFNFPLIIQILTERIGIFLLLIFTFLKFNMKQHCSNGKKLKNRNQIAQFQLRSFSFYSEIISNISIIYCLNDSKSLIQFLFFLRIYEIKQIKQYTKEHILFNRNQLAFIFELVSLAGLFLLYSHVSACIFYYIGANQNDQQNTWINQSNLQFENNQSTLYLYSFYFSWSTLLAIGYGDIVPVSNYEKIYILFNTFFNLFIQFQIIRFLISYAFSQFAQIKDYEQNNCKFKSNKIQFFMNRKSKKVVKQYLLERNISKVLQLKMLQELKIQNENLEYIQGEKIMSQFNHKIKQKLKNEIYLQYFMKNQIITNIFSQEFLIQLSNKMKEVLLLPNSVIQKNGQSTDRLQLILKGQIKSVFESNQDLEIDLFEEGSFIGLNEFLQQKQSNVTYKCQNYVILSYIERDDFLHLLHQYYEDFVIQILMKYLKFILSKQEKYKMVFEQSNEKFQFQFLQKVQICKCCSSPKHETINCPLIAINCQRDYVVQRYNFVKTQNRSQYLKKRKIRHQTLLKLQQTKKVVKQKRMDLIVQEQEEDKAILDIYEDIKNLIEWNDKQFLQRIPAFKIFQDGVLIDYENGDDVIDEESDEKTFNRDQQKSSNLSPDAKTNKTFKTNKTQKTNKTNKTNKSNVSHHNQESFTSVDKQSCFNQTEGEPPSIVENMKKQQRISKESRMYMGQKRNSFKESRDQQRRISDLIVEDYQQSQKSNIYRSFNESVPMSSTFIQSYFKLGSSQKDIQVYQPQSSKNLVLNKQNSLSSSQVMILQGGRAIRKSDTLNTNMIDNSYPQIKNFHEQEKRNSLLIQYNTNRFECKVQPNTKKIIKDDQQEKINQVNMSTFENEFDKFKEYRIFFPQNNLSSVIANLKKCIKLKKAV